MGARPRSVVWTRVGPEAGLLPGLEHLRLGQRTATSTMVSLSDDGGPFTLRYRMGWDDAWRLREARFAVRTAAGRRDLLLTADGEGRWRDKHGEILRDLEGCHDIDIWPTPFTNTFPVRRLPLAGRARRDRSRIRRGPGAHRRPATPSLQTDGRAEVSLRIAGRRLPSRGGV